MMGSIFIKNQNWNVVTKFRSFHTAFQNLGGFIVVQVCWGFFPCQKGKIIHANKRLGGSSSVIRFCLTDLKCVCSFSDRHNVGPGQASSDVPFVLVC